jgi:hypothetical protein
VATFRDGRLDDLASGFFMTHAEHDGEGVLRAARGEA